MVNDPSFESFIGFAGTMRPEFEALLQGATWQEISELERVAGVALPLTARQLLRSMGHGDGGLNLGIEGSLDIADVIDYYKETTSCDPHERLCPTGYFVLAARDGERDVCVSVLGGMEVILCSGEMSSVPYADTLLKLLHRDAFIAFGVEGRLHRGYLSGREGCPGPSLEEADAVARKLDFVSDWYSDSTVSCLRSAQESLMTLTLCEGGAIGVSVGARTRRQVLRVWWEFRSAFGFELVAWK